MTFLDKIKKYLFNAIGIFALLIMTPVVAWSVQVHGSTEGLVAHEIGHILFAVGMGYLLFRIYHRRFKGTDWFEFKVFLYLIIVWNFITFSGHWINEFIAPEKFIKSCNGCTLYFSVANFTDAYFYFTRLDHLVLVPAFIFLLLALRKWSKQL